MAPVKSPYFKDWISKRPFVVVIVLFIVILSGLFQFGIYAFNKIHVIGSFGIEPEDLTFSILISYVAIIAFLPIQFRIIRYVEPRPYLMAVMIIAMLTNYLSMHTSDFYVFLILRLFSGFIACAIVGRALTLLFGHLRKQTAQILGSTLFYGSVLSSVVIVGLFSAWVADNMAWQCSYIYLIGFHLFTMLVIWVTLKGKAQFKRFPLYQIDWHSFIYALIGFTSFAFLFIYGPKYDWMEDTRCFISAMSGGACIGLLFLRQAFKKRPYIQLEVFKSRRFVLALCLLGFYYGIKDSLNLVYGYAGGVLHWNNLDIARLGLANIVSMILTMFFSSFILIRHRRFIRALIIGGFVFLMLFNLWMFLIIGNDLSFAQLLGPVLLQGVASGGLFVPLVVFALGSIPAHTGYTGITLAAVARFFGLLNASAGFYSLQQFYTQTYNSGFLNHLSLLDGAYAQYIEHLTELLSAKGTVSDQAASLSQALLYRNMSVQSMLLTDRAIFKILALIIAGLLLLLLSYRILAFLRLRFGQWIAVHGVDPVQ